MSRKIIGGLGQTVMAAYSSIAAACLGIVDCQVLAILDDQCKKTTGGTRPIPAFGPTHCNSPAEHRGSVTQYIAEHIIVVHRTIISSKQY
ncbi:hypothetical protein AAKU61_004095 [Undibacterium sp. GrIS 1.2]|uniref:hypothetical protein n=1 Tax=Undibacterium sp. GrIS 1.2 TaxID=3143933 RepID=UPI003396B1DE